VLPFAFTEDRSSPSSFHASEFPRIEFGGNSSNCIKTAASEGHDYYHSLPASTLGSVLPFQSKRTPLSLLGLAAVCNVGRIIMHTVA